MDTPPYTLVELASAETFDPSTLCPQVSFTQATFYGEWQAYLGRPVRRFVVRAQDTVIAYFQVISYPAFGRARYLYIPYGPVTKDVSAAFCVFLQKELRNIAREAHAVFVRLDFTPAIDESILKQSFTRAPQSTYHSAYFQPRVEWRLPLEGADEELLAQVHEKNRYAIRLAERKGVVIEVVTKDFFSHFDAFYTLMSDTASRNGFHLHPKAYYEHIFATLESKNMFLVVGRVGGEIAVIDLIVVYGTVAHYVFAGASTKDRSTSASSLSVWQAILHAKHLGCTYFNFGGITQGDDHKSWAGLTRFKKRFGGEEYVHSDFYDLVINPLLYGAYNLRKWIQRLRG